MKSLNQQLATLRAEKEVKRDPSLTAVLNRATEELQSSGIVDGARTVGDQAPFFSRPDVNGKTIRLRSLLKRGPTVVSFFRGRW